MQDVQHPEVARPTIIDWVKWKARDDLNQPAPTLKDAREKLMEKFIPTPMVDRKVTKVIEVKFSGSFAQFQAHADKGLPIAVKLGELFSYKKFLPRHKRARAGMSPLEVSLCTQLTPDVFDMTKCIVHDVTIHSFNNTFPAHLGLHCDAVPEAYMNMGDKEIKNLLRFFTDGAETWCNKHIPASTKGDWRIPVIREVGNGFNSQPLARTFGSVYNGQQLMNGITVLPVELCKSLGLPAPKKPYVVADDVDTDQLDEREFGQLKLNTWCLVPQGHAHTWATTLPAAHLRQLGYEIHEIKVEGETPEDEEYVPFYLMDFLTIDKLNYFVSHHTLPKIDKRDIRDITFTLQPFMESRKQDSSSSWTGGPKWTDYQGDVNEPHELTLSMVISYTMFPVSVAQNAQMCCMLTPDFPPMRVDGAIPLMKGPEEGQGHQKRDKH